MPLVLFQFFLHFHITPLYAAYFHYSLLYIHLILFFFQSKFHIASYISQVALCIVLSPPYYIPVLPGHDHNFGCNNPA